MVRRAVFVTVAAFLAFVGALSLFLPLPRGAGAEPEAYVCRWENGETTTESYISAYSDLIGTGYGVTLEREGVSGTVSPSAAYTALYPVLRSGGLSELLRADGSGITRLERTAIHRSFSGRIWYSGGFFVWGEQGLTRASSAKGDSLVLLSGSITAATLLKTGATSLELRADADFHERILAGTAISRVTACPPYAESGGAITLNTGAGIRLVGGVPAATELTVPEVGYADTGALIACGSLVSLTLPFLGNALDPAATDYDGLFAVLFSDGASYFVPPSLRTIRVTGGVVPDGAFYLCGHVREINLCGVAAEHVHVNAFADCTGLTLLHSPNADVILNGTYARALAPCGCTVFARIEE